ncbi:hypothetical protein APA_5331 [Pseudanabaena sp. lw0831]|uniref:hypothetical protein n=1 Tax=unclassified Pseudanabaena TaxID=2593292 RepID=UPI000CD9EC92|nr:MULTISPECIES: hypothetical protein [unclassified Pseudanabaena]GBO52241.1 hypothetical protein APA_5331 [Pseudanabaena sp. lw0831]
METNQTLSLILGAIALGAAIWATSAILELLAKLVGKFAIATISLVLVAIYLKVYVGVDIWQSLVDFGQIVIATIGQLVDAVSSLFSQAGSVVNELTE